MEPDGVLPKSTSTLGRFFLLQPGPSPAQKRSSNGAGLIHWKRTRRDLCLSMLNSTWLLHVEPKCCLFPFFSFALFVFNSKTVDTNTPSRLRLELVIDETMVSGLSAAGGPLEARTVRCGSFKSFNKRDRWDLFSLYSKHSLRLVG